MSARRRDLHKLKLRRDRIRREKHSQRPGTSAPPDLGPDPVIQHPFASERAMREIHALMEGQKFESVEEINARLQELTAGGRLSEMAQAWKQDDPKWRAQELAYDALEADSLIEALQLANQALSLDPDCTDAQRLMVSLLPAPLDNRIHLIREVVEKAERNLGESFFEQHMGHFWGTISTRPYMRAKQHLGELLAEAGHLEEAAAIFERMLELNTNDNQGIRYPLLGLYLASTQLEPARRLMSRYPGEEKFMGSFAWARVLERWLSGESAEAALARARKVNPFAEPYISGAREFPREAPAYFRPGEESEARVCARELAPAWQRHPAFRQWLRAHGNVP
ncbi:MAG: tetratricopeptide repeat protein [Acidobacteria bacterium]|nr:tetratricopeptide repeat protein [Acidobacteriota bacterium]